MVCKLLQILMPMRGSKVSKLATGPKPGIPDDSTAKSRSKFLGISADQTAAALSLNEFSSANEHRKDSVAQLNEELARRQESYIRRERQYKIRISELEGLLSDSRAKKSKENTLDAAMNRVRSMHRDILVSVDQVQNRTSEVLQEQEKDLLRAFRARLYSVQEELESEKNKTDDGAFAWVEKSKQLENEVEWTKELADRLDRLNQSLSRENHRLKTQFAAQENDRDFLVKQLVTVKKDNASLRLEVETLRQHLNKSGSGQLQHNEPSLSQSYLFSASTSALPKMRNQNSMATMALAKRPNTAEVNKVVVLDSDNRYKEVIKRLKRLLEVERRNLQQVRTAYTFELQSHSELENILKECVKDVRAEVARVSQLPVVISSSSIVGNTQQVEKQSDRLKSSERHRLVEKLMEKDQVLKLLTAKVFPVFKGKHYMDTMRQGETGLPDEFAKLHSHVTMQTSVESGNT